MGWSRTRICLAAANYYAMTIRAISGLLLAGGALLGSCNCPEAETGPVPFVLQFSTDTLNAGRGFRRAELQAAYLVRYDDAAFIYPVDTLRFVTKSQNEPGILLYYPTAFSAPQAYLPYYIDNGNHYAQGFKLQLPGVTYYISNLELQMSDSKGFCEQSHTDHYYATVNGQRVDARGGYLLTR
jgi:hypothetical protein